jgi:branched-chain amino acid transport system ATP-binding protein
MSARVEAALAVEGLTKRFGGVAAVEDVTLSFADGSLTAIIGPNGAGKSTFFNLLSGALPADAGRVALYGENVSRLSRTARVRRGIGRAFQVAKVFPQLTVAESLQAAVAGHMGTWGGLLRRFPPGPTIARGREIAAMLGLLDKSGTETAALSHGDQKLLDIALALALEPRVLLLDEPTAGMGPEERWQMIEKLARLWEEQRLTLVFIEHDMDIVFRIAQRIAVLCYGKLLAEGEPAAIRDDPQVITAYLGAPEQDAL